MVAFPTETVYGLGANALSARAVGSIFAAKGRPSWDPLIVHLPDPLLVRNFVQLDAELEQRVAQLSTSFWPGPLTLLLPRTSAIPDEVTAGRAKVGVRIPAHPVALALLRAAGTPIAAPSANRFSHISPTTAQHVLDDLDGRIDAVLDGGPTAVGVESTVLDPQPTPMLIYRAGAITAGQLSAATGIAAEHYLPNTATDAEPAALPSPGVGIRHYAPDVHLVLSGPDLASLQVEVRRAATGAASVGVLLPRDWQLGDTSGLTVQPWGEWNDSESLAAELFAALRALESCGVATIVCPLPTPGGLGDALRDRLMKAARPREAKNTA